jgi:RecJ-like exonuclease
VHSYKLKTVKILEFYPAHFDLMANLYCQYRTFVPREEKKYMIVYSTEKEEGKCQGKGHVNIEDKAKICKGEAKREIRRKIGGNKNIGICWV